MVWLRRCTHYLFIVVVAVNSTLLTINAGDYIFYTDWMWTSYVIFTLSQSLMLAVGAAYYLTFTGVPGTATYYALIMTVYTWIAKGAWFSLGYPYSFIVVPKQTLPYPNGRCAMWNVNVYVQHDQSIDNR